MSRAQDGGASSHSTPQSAVSADATPGGATVDEGRSSRRRTSTGTLTRTESSSEGEDEDEEEDEEEEEDTGASRRRARRAATSGSAVLSPGADGEGEGKGDGEGEAVLGEPLRSELEKHMSGMEDEEEEEGEGEGPMGTQEVVDLVSGAIEGLMGRRRGHSRPRCLHTAQVRPQ